MKMLVIGNKERVEKFLPDMPVVRQTEITVVERGASDEEILVRAADADFIMADAISPVSAHLMESMPNLKLVHSEGVAYNAIDLDAARRLGIAVCNNAGANAGAVAEQTILLMLACLRDAIQADASVRAGKQIETKERMMVEGIRELEGCTVGFIGFGDIAKATAKRLVPWGVTMHYNKRTALSPKEEHEFGATYMPLDELLAASNIVSIHVPVTDATRGMVDTDFLAKMRPDAILINTARGEIVDTQTLADALENGTIAMAGLDTIAPEPVQLDNPLLNLSPDAAKRIVFSPHIGGVTEGVFRRMHRGVWENVECVIAGRPLKNRIV